MRARGLGPRQNAQVAERELGEIDTGGAWRIAVDDLAAALRKGGAEMILRLDAQKT